MVKTMSAPNLVVVSDLHVGCQLGLCPPKGMAQDAGGIYTPSSLQRKVLEHWDYFWQKWVPKVTRGEPYAVLVNGDLVDGVHHRSVTQITHNIDVQRAACYELLAPVRDGAADMYIVRGTEAHSGQSGQDEEAIGRLLGAHKTQDGKFSRYSLWLKVGDCTVHASHHVGTTSSTAYESSAPSRAQSAMFENAGRWAAPLADVVIRSHRHTHVLTMKPTARGYGIVFTTACWQLPTPFVYKKSPEQAEFPQFGGHLVRQGDEEFYTRHYVQTFQLQRVSRPKVEGK